MPDEWDALKLELSKLAAALGASDFYATPIVDDLGKLDRVTIYVGQWSATGLPRDVSFLMASAASPGDLEASCRENGLLHPAD